MLCWAHNTSSQLADCTASVTPAVSGAEQCRVTPACRNLRDILYHDIECFPRSLDGERLACMRDGTAHVGVGIEIDMGGNSAAGQASLTRVHRVMVTRRVSPVRTSPVPRKVRTCQRAVAGCAPSGNGPFPGIKSLSRTVAQAQPWQLWADSTEL